MAQYQSTISNQVKTTTYNLVNNTFPRPYMTPPTINADIAVPITANTKIEPIFWKKSPYRIQYEEQDNK